MYCGLCGTKIDDGSKICSKCSGDNEIKSEVYLDNSKETSTLINGKVGSKKSSNKIILMAAVIMVVGIAALVIWKTDIIAGLIQKTDEETASNIFLPDDKNNFNAEIENFETNAAPGKVWTIKFSSEIHGDALTKDDVELVDSNGMKIEVGIEVIDKMTVNIKPPVNGYVLNESYTLRILNSIKDTNNKTLDEIKTISFQINDSIKSVENIDITINHNDKYDLKKYVNVTTANNTQCISRVSWNAEKIDTGKYGKNIIEGTVSGYNNKIKMNVTVVPSDEELKKLFYDANDAIISILTNNGETFMANDTNYIRLKPKFDEREKVVGFLENIFQRDAVDDFMEITGADYIGNVFSIYQGDIGDYNLDIIRFNKREYKNGKIYIYALLNLGDGVTQSAEFVVEPINNKLMIDYFPCALGEIGSL